MRLRTCAKSSPFSLNACSGVLPRMESAKLRKLGFVLYMCWYMASGLPMLFTAFSAARIELPWLWFGNRLLGMTHLLQFLNLGDKRLELGT